MSFSFGLFRFLSYGNIFVVGLLMILMLMVMLFAPAMTPIVIVLMIFAVVLYHNILCLRLQRSIQDAAFPLGDNFPTILIITSVLSFIYSMMVFSTAIDIARLSSAEFRKMIVTGSPDPDQITLEMTNAAHKTILILFSIHGLTIATNCVLSSVFLNKWKKTQQGKEKDSFLDT